MRALTRRSALRGSLVALLGAAGGYLVTRASGGARPPSGAGVANAYGPPTAGGGRMLVVLDQVPVGGGVVLGKEKVVVTRPGPGDVRAFSAVCTHQGCTVDAVVDGAITCPCHGSSFDAGTGAVRHGPATRPLPPVAVLVRSGKVFTS